MNSWIVKYISLYNRNLKIPSHFLPDARHPEEPEGYFSKGYRETNIILYSRLDANNLTKQKLLNYADLLRVDTVSQRTWLFIKSNQNVPIEKKVIDYYPDTDDFFDLGFLDLKNNKWYFEMNEKFQEIQFNNDEYISRTWQSTFNIFLRE